MPGSYICSSEKGRNAIEFIRDMTVKDLNEVLAIEETAFPTPWTRGMFLEELKVPICIARVAVDGNTVLGYSCFALVFDEAHLRNIAVHRDWRRRGIASCLMEDMISISVEEKAYLATLEVRRSSIHAQHLYEQFGFQVTGVRPRYYSDTDEDALIMWADLREHTKKKEISNESRS